MKIKKEKLLILAGLFWLIGGINVLKIGYSTDIQMNYKLYILFVVTFTFFFFFVFERMNRKNIDRINKLEEKVEIYKMFSLKSYVIIIFMMTMGIVLRKYNLVSLEFVRYFYSALGYALAGTGAKSIKAYYIK